METFKSDTSFIINHVNLNVTPELHLHTQSGNSHQVTVELLSTVKKSVIVRLYETFKLDFELFDYDPTFYIALGVQD